MRRIMILLLLAALLAGCGRREQERQAGTEMLPTAAIWQERSVFAMDTLMQIKVYGGSEHLLDKAQKQIFGLEESLSVTLADSEIAQLNRNGRRRLSGDPLQLLDAALTLCRETDGALDLTIYPVVQAWGFTTGDYRVPSEEELAVLLAAVDYTEVRIEEDGEVVLPAGAQLDLGSVAKGYLGDLLCTLLRTGGAEHAMLNLGGNVQVMGGKPDGSDWSIGIRDPEGTGLLGTVGLQDGAVVTSGGYERYFTDEDGDLWWHIMDPRTGMPARSGLVSVTVLGAQGLVCDALSTALFVMGEEKALAYWRTHGEVELALVTEDERLILTPGLAERFVPAGNLAYALEVADGKT